MSESSQNQIVEISGWRFMMLCALAALALVAASPWITFSGVVIAGEVFLVIISLFIFGSIRYRLDKNALTYGAVLVVGSTFFGRWWPGSYLRQAIQEKGWIEILVFIKKHGFTLHGLDQLVHADTMLFILGLTFFVCVIAQTRLLETVSFKVLERTKGNVVITVAILTAIVSIASGILDGVSMIGLMIRTLVIILFLAKSKDEAVTYAVMVSTVVTTVCGMWLAYGEPPNLIMKANLHPHLDNVFFLRYCLPVAVASYFIVLWNIKKRLADRKVEIDRLDVLDRHTADVRFLQASRHGEVLTPIEFAEEHHQELGERLQPVLHALHLGEPLGSALVQARVPEDVRKQLIGKFVDEGLADTLDKHYQDIAEDHTVDVQWAVDRIQQVLEAARKKRVRAQIIGGISFIPFIGLLIAHGMNHHLPLFYASFAGFAVAFLGILAIPKMRNLALREARLEYMEYLFLFPLFFSITMLQKSGFFSQISSLLHKGIEVLGVSHIAYIQFLGATFLSAILDNNVVADFTSRALHGLDMGILYLFSMAQIAGYAVGGCWTHIGCAQSVVAYSFLQKEVDEHYTPFQWVKAMTPIIMELIVLLTLIIYGEGLLLRLKN